METSNSTTVRKITNIDGIVKTFNTDKEFLRYVRKVYKQREDGSPYGKSTVHWLPENIENATEYITEYCEDLNLEEN